MSLPNRDGVNGRYYLIHKPDTAPEVLEQADICIEDIHSGSARENHSAYPVVIRNHNGTPFLPNQLLERYLYKLPLKGFPYSDAVNFCDALRRLAGWKEIDHTLRQYIEKQVQERYFEVGEREDFFTAFPPCTVWPELRPEDVDEGLLRFACYVAVCYTVYGQSFESLTTEYILDLVAQLRPDMVKELKTNGSANPPSYSGLHHYAAALDYNGNPKELWDLPQRPMGSYSILVDLMPNADCGQKTFLYICDGLASTVNQGKTLTVDDKWCSAPFGDGTKSGSGWTASLFASQDPVAIDSVALDFLTAERDACRKVGDNSWNSVLPDDNTAENYLIESALADNPPSGVAYQDGYGNPVGSLGVFQHWNNAEEKLYGRNLGDDEGIELIAIEY